MFGRYRCKRNDFHKCCCKEKPKCECEKCHCKTKVKCHCRHEEEGINNKKSTIRTLFGVIIFHLEQISLQLTMCLSF